MPTNASHRIETLCVHAGIEPEPHTGAIMTPIFQTATYVQKAPGVDLGYDYSRGANPTREVLEAALAGLEGCRHAITFASGMAAEQAIIQTLEPGDHVLVSEDAYGGTGRLFRRLFAKYKIEFEFIDLRDLDQVQRSLRAETKLVWVETPTNPLLQIVNIRAVCEIVRARGARVVVDNTFCTPIVQRPMDLGADLSVYSTTKYIAGHSDLIGGAVLTNDDEMAERIRFVQFAGGAVNAPFECFLLLRSIKTLALRMAQHNRNGLALAQALETSGLFRKVIYPGLKSHPEHELAASQMNGFSGVVSVYLSGGMDRVIRFLQGLRVFSLAESLGGVESLVNHPETMTHASVPPELRQKLGINSELVRFSVGIENVHDLIEDIYQAMRA